MTHGVVDEGAHASGQNTLAGIDDVYRDFRGFPSWQDVNEFAGKHFRAKLAQENLIKASTIPYTILRATQFFEFLGSIAQASTQGMTIRLPSVGFQPIVSDDVAGAVADVAVQQPLNATIELGGPELFRLDETIRKFLKAKRDERTVVTDGNAPYFGIPVTDKTLIPGDKPRLGHTRLENWLGHSVAA